MSIGIRVRLTYPNDLIKEPIIATLARDFEVLPNIRKAEIEGDMGWVICEIQGDAKKIDSAISWLKEKGIEVEILGSEV
jgi:ABC-type methionine transport system ATPase subunit